MTERSSADLIKRVSASSDENYGISYAGSVPADTPALVAFGGGLTNSVREANYYASLLFRLLDSNGIHGVDVYSVFYDLQKQDTRLTRLDEFRRAGHRLRNYMTKKDEKAFKEMRAAEEKPQYIEKLFDIILRPRVFDAAGQRLTLDEALSRIRKLKFFAQCHGSMAIYLMGQLMANKMRGAGYSAAEIRQIQQQLLVVQYAPANPLEKNKFTVISFASAYDNMMAEHNNFFAEYVLKHQDQISPAFVSAPHGNVFFAGRLNEGAGKEHDLSMELWQEPYLTDDGRVIYSAMRHAIVRGAQHSLTGGPLPEISALLTDCPENFEAVRAAGDALYEKMLQEARRRNK